MEEEYEVEKIVSCRRRGNGLELLIKWVGYEEKTWEPLANLTNCDQKIKDFRRTLRLLRRRYIKYEAQESRRIDPGY